MSYTCSAPITEVHSISDGLRVHTDPENKPNGCCFMNHWTRFVPFMHYHCLLSDSVGSVI